MMDHLQEQHPHRRFIALLEVERDELDEVTGGWVVFDSFIKADLSDYLNKGMFSREVDDWGLLTLRAPFKEVMNRFPLVAEREADWVTIDVTSNRNENFLTAEVVLFGDNAEPPRVSITELARVPDKLRAHLQRKSMLFDSPRAHAGFIAGVLDIPLRDQRDLAVVAYDVGQGNCNAIVDRAEHPRIFFDLGWAPNFHASTRPTSPPDLFSCRRHATPPVVLSHWDMDHWSYAIAQSTYNPANLTTRHEWKAEALERFWIARAPEVEQHQLGPLTQSFYRALTRTHLLPGLSAILLWPDNTKRIDFSAGWLEACSPGPGLPNDRNNSGLAMFVRPDPKGPAVVLTGDADFPSIPSLAGKRRKPPLAGMIAPHHGSRITETAVPSPKKGTPARLVMSVGRGNSYGHPKQQAISAYAAKGWLSALTQDRFDCTRTPDLHQHGNTMLKFSSAKPDPRCGCGCVESGNLCLVPSAASTPAPAAGTKSSTKKTSKTASFHLRPWL